MKKILLIVSSIFIPLIILFIVILTACLVVLNFFGTDSTDGYVVDNMAYAGDYRKVLNQNIDKGYVSLERLLYFYLADTELSYSKIYIDNLDLELKKMKPISQVCTLDDYKNLSVCSSEQLSASKQINEYQNKPFGKPLDFSATRVSSFFMEQRVVFDKYNVHKAWDFSSSAQTKVYSVCDGIIEKVSFPYSKNEKDINGGLGNHIVLKCNINEKIYRITYAHLFPNSYQVSVDDYVAKGQMIASVGTTGYSTGDHLQFQVQIDNKYIDGMSLIDFLDTNNKEENAIFNNHEFGQSFAY